MLRFSSSVAPRAPIFPTRAFVGSPTTTNTKDVPLITFKKGRNKEPPPYQYGENQYGENPVWESDSEEDSPIEEYCTQDAETLTLPVSDPIGLTHTDCKAAGTDSVEDGEKTYAHKTEPTTSDDTTNSSQSLPNNDGSSDKKDEEIADVQRKQNLTPIHGVRVPKYTLPQKRYIVAEAFSAPKRIRLTARKYKIANATLHHWKKLLEKSGIEVTKNVLIAKMENF